MLLKLIHSSLFTVIAALAYVFCNAVGGIGNATINSTSLTSGGNNTYANASTTGGGSLPVPISFTGAAIRTLHHELGWLAAALLGLLGRVVFL